MKTFISIYKSPKKEGMYIYLEKEKGVSVIPENLLTLFGEPVLVTHMAVDESRSFARFETEDLFEALKEKGFYLQLPEPLPEYREFVVKNNDRLS